MTIPLYTLIGCILSFMLAFILSTVQYGQDKFRSTFPILYFHSLSFACYGFAYGIMAIVILVILFPNHFSTTDTFNWKFFLSALTVGILIKGFLNTKILEMPAENGGKITISPKLITDTLENVLQNFIKTRHHNLLLRFIDKSLKRIDPISTDDLRSALINRLPPETKAIDSAPFTIATATMNKSEIIYTFVQSYQFSYFKEYLRSK